MRTPPFPCAMRITRSAPSYSWRRIDFRRWSFARPAFVTKPTTSRSPTVWRIARIDRWNSWCASPTSTSSSRNIVGRHASTTRPARVSSIFLSSISNINVVIWLHVNARATWIRGRISSRVSAARFPRATMPCGSTEFPPSRKTTSWPSMTARTDSKVVRWNTKSEPLSYGVVLAASNGPRVWSGVGTRVVRAGRVSTRTSGTTMASAARAMEILPANRWRWRYKVGGGGEVGESALPTQVASHRLEMEVQVPLRVAPPPRRRERDEDPTDVPRSDIHVERDAGAVALRVESIRVLDVRGGIARVDRVAERRVEDHTLIDRDPHRSRRTVPQPHLVPGPPQDGARAVRGRSGVPVVVLAEVRPPREDRISRQRRLAVQAEPHPPGTRRATNYEIRELTLFQS